MIPHPIAVFDSGLGGLTVLRALRERLPQEKDKPGQTTVVMTSRPSNKNQ